VFRVVRSYFTLAAVLSLNYPPLHPRWPGFRRRRPSRAADPGSVHTPP
jgi:hypothetical protein